MKIAHLHLCSTLVYVFEIYKSASDYLCLLWVLCYRITPITKVPITLHQCWYDTFSYFSTSTENSFLLSVSVFTGYCLFTCFVSFCHTYMRHYIVFHLSSSDVFIIQGAWHPTVLSIIIIIKSAKYTCSLLRGNTNHLLESMKIYMGEIRNFYA